MGRYVKLPVVQGGAQRSAAKATNSRGRRAIAPNPPTYERMLSACRSGLVSGSQVSPEDRYRDGERVEQERQIPRHRRQRAGEDRRARHRDPVDDDLRALDAPLAVLGDEVAEQHNRQRRERRCPDPLDRPQNEDGLELEARPTAVPATPTSSSPKNMSGRGRPRRSAIAPATGVRKMAGSV